MVEGSVRKDGERVRITVQLGDVATGSQLWAERYDRQLADVFALQDEITTELLQPSSHSSTPPKIFAPSASRPTACLPTAIASSSRTNWHSRPEESRATRKSLR
jgi:hypothetical protein